MAATSRGQIEKLRNQFVADCEMWCGRLGYQRNDFEVSEIMHRNRFDIVGGVDGEVVHGISIPSKGIHPRMRKAIVESFREAIRADTPAKQMGVA